MASSCAAKKEAELLHSHGRSGELGTCPLPGGAQLSCREAWWSQAAAVGTWLCSHCHLANKRPSHLFILNYSRDRSECICVGGFFVSFFYTAFMKKKKEQMKQQVWQVAILKPYIKSFSLHPCQNISRNKWNDLSDVGLDLRISCTLVGDIGKQVTRRCLRRANC